jgi:hypothetical protein
MLRQLLSKELGIDVGAVLSLLATTVQNQDHGMLRLIMACKLDLLNDDGTSVIIAAHNGDNMATILLVATAARPPAVLTKYRT